MNKSDLLKRRNRLVPSLSKVKKRIGYKPPPPREPPFATITIRHVMFTPLADRYPDAPRKYVDSIGNRHCPAAWRLPYPFEERDATASHVRRRYFRFETERFDRMVRLLMEEIMDKEIALRTGEALPTEWTPEGSVDWTPAMAQALLDHIANGGTYLSFANRQRISRAAVVAFAGREEIAPLVAKAARYGVDAMAEAALEAAGRPFMVEEVIETIAPDGSLVQKNVRRRDQVEARRLAYESRMKYLAKIAPNRYGDKPEVQETDGMAEKILKARKRLGE